MKKRNASDWEYEKNSFTLRTIKHCNEVTERGCGPLWILGGTQEDLSWEGPE